MGSMASPSKSIDRLSFKKLPKGNALKCKFAQSGTTVVLLGEKGALYTNISGLNGSYHMGGSWRWSEDITECLDKLGLLNAEDKERHLKWCAELDRRRKVISDLGDAKRALEKEPNSAIKTVIDDGKLIEMWDSLPYWDQKTADDYGYRPAGAVLKKKPEAA